MTDLADPLLQPFRLKHLVLKNRVLSTSHAMSYGVGGMPADRYQAYHEEKAKGGLALTMFGGSSNVSVDSASVFGQLNLGVDAVIPYLQQLAARVHRHGAATMTQITHLGRRSSPYEGEWLTPIGPSRRREMLHRATPKVMDGADIARVVADYAAAARRCRLGDLDGCELVASSHLIGQFFSPMTNVRTDEYGGSLENRVRFGLLVLEAIRKEVGDDFIVGLRLSIDEGTADGLSGDACLELAQRFEREGTVDYFNVMYGRTDTSRSLHEENMPGMAQPNAPYVGHAREFRAAVALPVFHAARITDIATARDVIESGAADMVGMTRAHIADPYLVAKVVAGEEDRIRPCVGANLCVTPKRVCVHNASTGREGTLPHRIEVSAEPHRRVVVVGGGPGGLEAARVAAERGHHVVLFEATSTLGGQVLVAALGGWRKHLGAITQWLEAEVRRLGVDVRTDSPADRQIVLAEDPDTVIIATGGVADPGRFDGAEFCVTATDILTGRVAPGRRVIVIDGTGDHQAASCAEFLSDRGSEVEIMSPDIQYGLDLGPAEVVAFRKRFWMGGVVVTLDHALDRVERSSDGTLTLRFENMLTGAHANRIADQVITEYGTVPVDDVYHDLCADSRNNGVTNLDAFVLGTAQTALPTADGEFDLHRVGDAVSSRNIHAAILDSRRLCNSL